jgi:hypothetical protein
MGLDVYVGSLTRYYTGGWETVVQQWGREHGVEVMVVRPDQGSGRLSSLWGRLFKRNGSSSEEKTRVAVIRWRGELGRALGGDAGRAVDWDESAAAN